ncbi:MAG: CPXCG motif-containing cysteine-rich protein [Pseudomonadota bacterium]
MTKNKKTKTSAEVVCPFCGEAEELYVDLGGGEHQTYTEDCAVCCRPRVVHVSPGDFAGEVSVWLEREE